MIFHECRKPVFDRGSPPQEFLETLVTWASQAPDEIFAPNPVPDDIYASIFGTLGPWTGLEHRRAAMLEVMRVHGAFESSFNWNEGVDVTNAHSLSHIEGQEAGLWQVSADSMGLSQCLRDFIFSRLGTTHPLAFIDAMKQQHDLAAEYYARLIRVSVQWAGPLRRREIHPYLRRECVSEFQALV